MAIFQLLRERCADGCELSEAGADRTVTEIAKAFEDYQKGTLCAPEAEYVKL